MRYLFCVMVLVSANAMAYGNYDEQVCEPGEHQCQAGKDMKCNYEGTRWVYNGSCKKQVCDPGDEKCGVGSYKLRCSYDGTRWDSYYAPSSCR